MQSLTDVQNTAFMAIGPSRIAALSLLALSQGQSDSADTEPKAVLDLSVQRLNAAYAMLGSGLDELLEECRYSLPEPLEAKRKACRQVLQPLHKAISKSEQDVLQQLRAIPGLSDLCLFQLEPVISDFLKDMVHNLREAQQLREVQREENMRTTIANAESVGRNIKFISFNASIEAARIGDMGKGFAVIATEIRDLSGKTQTLLEEISSYLKH
ncbi:methyl-accepting chemotaxis protein [Leisingera sp. S232]|uniref:methyl-accepting chemotaxis protein n=1 Tax=Leisingera sp. S232 TaxID=3415132 RepID=UPI000869F10C|nr:chemotaxis protein [Rhodobacteraceae bacterium (ex Bugula neritina AB1)]